MRSNDGYLHLDVCSQFMDCLLNGRTVLRGVMAGCAGAQLSVRSSVSGGMARPQRSCYKSNRDHGTATLDRPMVVPRTEGSDGVFLGEIYPD